MRLSLLMVVVVAVSGCMLGPHALTVSDYRPQTPATAQAYYQCLRGAQQPYAAAQFGAGGGVAYGTAAASVATNRKMVCACMGSEGYTLRRATGGEVFADFILLPVETLFIFCPDCDFAQLDGSCP